MEKESQQPDPDPVDILRAAGWPAPASATPVTGGWDTQIWRVQMPDGALHALRVYRLGPWAEGASAREVAALRAAAEGNLPTPAVQAVGEFESRRYLILSWLDGLPLSKVLGSRPWELWRLGITFGRMQARLHAIPPPAELSAPGRADWAGLVPDNPLAAAVRSSAGPAVFCHGDYHPVNVLAVPTRITGLIDFMNTMAADRRADLGITHTILVYAPLEPDPLQPVFQVARRLFARAWRRGYRSRAGSFPLDPLFEAWGAAYYLRGLEDAVRGGRGWATPEDAARLQRYIEGRKRDAGVGGPERP